MWGRKCGEGEVGREMRLTSTIQSYPNMHTVHHKAMDVVCVE